MILHYANLCVVAGGVDLFLLGSELRGIETIRGPGLDARPARPDANGQRTWDYPFVAGLTQLAADVRAVFDARRPRQETLPACTNLIAYSADWSTGWAVQHAGRERPMAASRPALRPRQYRSRRLRQLPAAVRLDDRRRRPRCAELARAGARRALAATADDDERPRPSGQPTIYTLAYLKANIEGGEKLQLVLQRRRQSRHRPRSERHRSARVACRTATGVTQTRNRLLPPISRLLRQQAACAGGGTIRIRPIYDDGDGTGWIAARPRHRMGAAIEIDRLRRIWLSRLRSRRPTSRTSSTTPQSTESATPFWSIWEPARSARAGPPRRDDAARRSRAAGDLRILGRRRQ